MNDEFINLAKLIIENKKKMFNELKVSADYIMDNQIDDSNFIEHILDYLVDCCYDEESDSYYHKLCDYYEKINYENAKFYKKLFKKMNN